MSFPLASFEKHIDTTILKRGKSYFDSGAVLRLEEMTDGKYEAEVEGTEVYEVHVTLQNGTVEYEDCDCPYEDDTCKHVVAVLYAIREEREPSPTANTKTSKKTAKQEPVATRLDKVLKTMSTEQLRTVLRKHCLDDENLRRSLFLQYEKDAQTVDSSEIRTQINRMLKRVAGRHGYIDYYSAGDAAASVGQVLDQAEQSLSAGRPLDALVIASVVMEEMAEAMEHADDSNGEISAVVDGALDVMEAVAALNPLDEKTRQEGYAYCCQAYEKRLFEDWDWHLPMLKLAAEFARTESEQATVLQLAERPPKSEYYWEGQREVAKQLIQKFQGDEAAFDYLHAHIEVYRFRKELTDIAIAAGDWEHADNLAQEGWKQDKLKAPGHAYDWLKIRLQIAEQQQDAPKAIQLSRQLFDEHHYEPMIHFKNLKRHVPKAEWPTYLEQLITSVKSRPGTARPLLAEIYAHEGMKEPLMTLVQQAADPQFTKQYQDTLKAKFKNQLIQVWVTILQKSLRYCTDRKSYAVSCSYLKQMKALGGGDTANLQVTQIRMQFANRPAFLDELRRAGF